jgi:hypothetical protein
MLFRLFGMLALVLYVSVLAVAQETADTEERNSGPKNLVITYRCAPAKRPAARQYMLKEGARRFEKWKRDAVLADYRILFSRYTDADTYDMMVVLNFKSYADVKKWGDIEASSPGGLTEEALGFITPTNTYSMDMIWHGSAPSVPPRGKTVFFLIPYDYYPHRIDEYIKYADGYVIPQIKGWVEKNNVSNYGIYVNRYPTSRSWKVLFVLEYMDSEAFGARERTMAEVRAALKSNSEWKALSDSKLNMRVEKETVVADELLPQ